MTSNEILVLVRKKILENTTEIVDDATLLSYLNMTNDDIVKRTFTNSSITSSVINFTNGSSTLPVNFGTAYGDGIDSSNNFYKELNIEDFSKETETHSFTIEAGSIKIFPTNTTSITLKFWPKVTTLTSSVNPAVDSLLHECYIYGILYRVEQDLQDESLSNYYKQIYESDLKQKLGILSSYEEDNQKSGTMFTEQTLI